MQPLAKLYSLTSVTLHGTVMLIPAVDFKGITYPFDLEIILPTFIFAKKTIDPFLKFLHFINFHYTGKLTIASIIQIDVNPLLDELHRTYLRYWNENIHITVIPERRRVVEQEIINWTEKLPKTKLSAYIQRYYSISIKGTDWTRKRSLWKSLRPRGGKKRELTGKRLEKLREKYVEIWFKYMDKTEFSAGIRSKFPKFIRAMNQLTFKEILQDLRICPACEADLNDYPSDITFCPFCGSNLRREEENILEPEVKFCANCGSQLRPKTSFCSNCGKKIVK